MDKFNFSAKHVAINKANAQIVAVVGLASFISIFCLVAAKAVYSQYQYQSRVIKAASSANTKISSIHMGNLTRQAPIYLGVL
jgi:hypothetical protein